MIDRGLRSVRYRDRVSSPARPPNPQPVVVTGAAGFVGTYLARHLTDLGQTVVSLDRADGPDLIDGPAWVELFAKIKPAAVYHLAGWADVGASWNQPAETFKVNADGTLNVLEASLRAGVGRVLVVSSADVYGQVQPDELPLTEQSPLRPRSPYGVSKESAEALARRYDRTTDLEVVVARPFNHIGPGQSPHFAVSAFAHRIAEAERANGGEIVHGDLSARRDLTDVRDVVRAYRLLIEEGTAGTTYNVCSEQAVEMAEILARLIAMSTAEVESRTDPELLRPVELPVLEGSARRIKTDTGWNPTISLETSLADVLAAARNEISRNEP